MTTDETDPKRTRLNLSVPEAMLWAQFASAALTGLTSREGSMTSDATERYSWFACEYADEMAKRYKLRFPT